MASADNAPKTVMQQIFESQRAELDRVNEVLWAKVSAVDFPQNW